MSEPESGPEPLPIWFFVGLVLLIYGALVLGCALFGGPVHTPSRSACRRTGGRTTPGCGGAR